MVDQWSDEERETWTAKVQESERHVELFSFEGSHMTPKQAHAWANLAAEFSGATIRGNSIYRPANEDEILLKAGEKADYARRYGSEDL